MADDSPNKTRIQAMLDDLAQKRKDQGASPQSPPVHTSASSVPGNLPVGQAGQPTPAPAARPTPPPAPKPVPPPSQTPAAVQSPPKPSAPAPAPTAPATAKQPAIPTPPSGEAGTPASTDTPPTTTEIRTMSADVQHLRTGQAPAPIQPLPASSEAQKPPTATQKPAPSVQSTPTNGIMVPEASSGGMNKKLIFGGIGALILIAIIIAAISLLGGDTAPVATPTPSITPVETATPTPVGKDLSFYFGQLTDTLDVPSDAPLPFEDFQNRLRALVPAAGQATNVEARGSTIFPAFLGNASEGTFGNTGAVLIFGQTEQFGANGEQQTLSTPEARLVYILEVADATAANQMMEQWEDTTLASDMSYYFNYNLNDALVSGFLDAVYRQIPVKYQNYPHADKSIDWAIVPASNNTNYLVISGSRESMFFTVNQLLK